MDRTEKAEAVSSLNATLGSAAAVVVVRNLGMTVAPSTVLRQQMRDAGADFRVTKNRVAKIALDGTSYTGIGELPTGPTALATSTDPVSAAKIAVEFAKTNDKLEIVGGGMGDVVLDVNGVKARACFLARRAPCQDHRSGAGSGHQGCADCRSPGGPVGAGFWRICRQRSSVISNYL